jgi:hypothetical protein
MVMIEQVFEQEKTKEAGDMPLYDGRLIDSTSKKSMSNSFLKLSLSPRIVMLNETH